jgi:hypothetical protein
MQVGPHSTLALQDKTLASNTISFLPCLQNEIRGVISCVLKSAAEDVLQVIPGTPQATSLQQPTPRGKYVDDGAICSKVG